MVILIRGDAGHELVGDRVVGDLPGIAMAHPGGQLLRTRVHKHVDGAGGTRVVAVRHGGEAVVLQLDRIRVAGGEQVAAQRDGVLALLRRPEMVPLLERRVLVDV